MAKCEKKACAKKACAKKAATPAKPMTKAVMIETIADTTGLTKTQVDAVYSAILDIVAKQTKKVGAFTLAGLGKFSKAQRKARIGHNPQTGAEIKIPAKTTVKFSVSKICKDAVLGK